MDQKDSDIKFDYILRPKKVVSQQNLLKISSWEHLEQMPTVMVTFVQAIFVQATFVLVTFVHIRNISALSDPILMKL